MPGFIYLFIYLFGHRQELAEYAGKKSTRETLPR